MATIAIVGAGSMEFTRQVMSDIVRAPALADSSFHLVDISAERLATAEGMVKSIIVEAGLSCPVHTFRQLDGAFDGVDYCINAIQVGGLRSTEIDFEIPARYGIHQTIADTLGVGGIFRGLRTIPAVLEIANALHQQSPMAIMLNYTNPMSMVIWALDQAMPDLQAYGLCHSVHYTAEILAEYLGVPFGELRWTSAGINHMAWMLTLEHENHDLYPRLFAAMEDDVIRSQDPVRFELMRRLGYFVTESSEHNAEYTAYFLTHPEEIERLNIPVGRYLEISRHNVDEFHSIHRALETPDHRFLMDPSPEYAPAFINACESGTTWWFQGTVINEGLIDNLPHKAAVEVPVLVNQHGVFACRIGSLPPQLAALNRQAMGLQELTVKAALTGDRDFIYQAAMMDPLASSVLTLDQIWTLVDDLITGHGEVLGRFSSGRLGRLRSK